MSEYYNTVYKKRLNRYGLDFQSRMKGLREKEFENYLLRTVFRVNFEYNGIMIPGSLERLRQDYSETQCYLLTRTETILPNGTILFIKGQNDISAQPWLVWWLEQIENSGYNRYIVLRANHFLSWLDKDGNVQQQWAYFSGPGTAAISDTITTSGTETIFKQNNNLHTFITAFNSTLSIDTYFEVETKGIKQGYVVAEFDINSTPGIQYVTVDPVPIRNSSPAPSKSEDDLAEDFFWLQGGNEL